MEPIKNNKEELPLEYYVERYRQSDAAEIAARCALPFDEATSTFTFELLGDVYAISHPDFTITGTRVPTNSERILFLRYLLDGCSSMSSGQFLPYREFPWGEVYVQQFSGRCIARYAFSYGFKPDKLRAIMERMPAQPIDQSDVGYEVTLMPGLKIRFLLWLGDEEFPPNAQILFSDNFRHAFSTEDMANIGDIIMGRMKAIGMQL
ncbi:MAG: DUF3786 domain-containing protein [Oscillospiraceae bacterium]|nr:DUF3786 domain-containing protein [Oscillospiraceae bacterium]